MSDSDRPWNRDEPQPTADESADDADNDSGALARQAAALAVGLGGPLVVVGGLVLLSTIASMGCGCQQVAPAVAIDWTCEDGSVELTHDGGDRITTDYTEYLEVRADGKAVATVGLPFEAGDTARVDELEPGETVRLVWYSDRNDETHELGSDEVPTGTGSGGE